MGGDIESMASERAAAGIEEMQGSPGRRVEGRKQDATVVLERQDGVEPLIGNPVAQILDDSAAALTHHGLASTEQPSGQPFERQREARDELLDDLRPCQRARSPASRPTAATPGSSLCACPRAARATYTLAPDGYARRPPLPFAARASGSTG